MSNDELLFFDAYPRLLPLYQALEQVLVQREMPFTVKAGRTQLSLRNRYVFAAVSLPWRRRKDWPEEFLLLSLGLGRKVEHPRISQAVEAYPGRWTHHILLTAPEELDATLLGWVEKAYRFARAK